MDKLVVLNDDLRKNVSEQLKIINTESQIVPFDDELERSGLHPLTATGVEVLQVNLGKMCNQTCKHCHVDAGPDRKEIMTRETMEKCLQVLDETNIPVVDLTGGAPELNPHFRWLVENARAIGVNVIDRCNLTILEEPGQEDLAQFLADNQVEITASLPCYLEENVDNQRGKGVYHTSIKGLQRLNQLGYGKENSPLKLNLVYNPVGPYLPPAQYIAPGRGRVVGCLPGPRPRLRISVLREVLYMHPPCIVPLHL